MSVVIVVGAQWGDEGKGRVVDLLAARADVVARYSGGTNAGHTVINDFGTFKLHLVPAGIFHPDCICVVGNGTVVTPGLLVQELEDLQRRGISTANLRISDRAHVILPHHMKQEALEESARGDDRIGTTGNGIGPAYVDKTAREGIRMADLIDPKVFRSRLAAVLEAKNRIFTRVYGAAPLELEPIVAEYSAYAEKLAPYVVETSALVRQAIKDGKRVLLEGAQATMLDLDFGTYPYVTTSHPVSAGACLGVGIGPTAITDVLAVVKAYSTRVGMGPMPTELLDEDGEKLREIGHEYGTTTGRARRCGWFDAVVGRFSTDVNGATRIAITRLDILDSFPVLKICVAYELDGARIETIPTNAAELARCKPIYEELSGWMQSTCEARTFDELPEAARRYVDRIAELLDVPVDLVGVGAARLQAIVRRELP